VWQRLLAADNHERYPERDRSVLSYLFSAEIRQAKIAEFGEVICDTFVSHLQLDHQIIMRYARKSKQIITAKLWLLISTLIKSE
jgi:hypothetical protein